MLNLFYETMEVERIGQVISKVAFLFTRVHYIVLDSDWYFFFNCQTYDNEGLVEIEKKFQLYYDATRNGFIPVLDELYRWDARNRLLAPLHKHWYGKSTQRIFQNTSHVCWMLVSSMFNKMLK